MLYGQKKKKKTTHPPAAPLSATATAAFAARATAQPAVYVAALGRTPDGPAAPGLYRQSRWAAWRSGAQVSEVARGTARAVAARTCWSRRTAVLDGTRNDGRRKRGEVSLVGRAPTVPVQPAESHAPPVGGGGGGGNNAHTAAAPRHLPPPRALRVRAH